MGEVTTAAVEAAERGWAVFPCRPGDKRPMVGQWEQRATSDPALVARWWPERANVGIACGPSALVVVDLDTHGTLPLGWQEPGIRDGADVLAVLAERHRAAWPVTYTVRTPSGGLHLYFTALPAEQFRNSSRRVGPLIDTRACGGYVVGAGSVTAAGPYTVLSDEPVAELPGWLWLLAADPPPAPPPPPQRATARRGTGRLAALAATVRDAPEGSRNSVLNWAGFRARELVASGEATAGEAAVELAEAAAAAGLSGREASRTLSSALGQAVPA